MYYAYNYVYPMTSHTSIYVDPCSIAGSNDFATELVAKICRKVFDKYRRNCDVNDCSINSNSGYRMPISIIGSATTFDEM